METLKLILPSAEYGEQLMAYRLECIEANSSMDGCGPLRRFDNAADYLAMNELYTDPLRLPEGRVLSTQFLCVRESDSKLVGMIRIRHYFNEYLEKYAGHIGYSVRPGERRKGYATEMLRLALPYCRSIGLEKVLIACEPENTGSEKTIISNGGVYESTVFEPGEDIYLKRYWITL